jgi:hypothetical protein
MAIFGYTIAKATPALLPVLGRLAAMTGTVVGVGILADYLVKGGLTLIQEGRAARELEADEAKMLNELRQAKAYARRAESAGATARPNG